MSNGRASADGGDGRSTPCVDGLAFSRVRGGVLTDASQGRSAGRLRIGSLRSPACRCTLQSRRRTPDAVVVMDFSFFAFTDDWFARVRRSPATFGGSPYYASWGTSADVPR